MRTIATGAAVPVRGEVLCPGEEFFLGENPFPDGWAAPDQARFSDEEQLPGAEYCRDGGRSPGGECSPAEAARGADSPGEAFLAGAVGSPLGVPVPVGLVDEVLRGAFPEFCVPAFPGEATCLQGECFLVWRPGCWLAMERMHVRQPGCTALPPLWLLQLHDP